MGLMKKIFGGGDGKGDTQPHSSRFHESETTAQHQNSRNAPRRELVHVVLRDTMRKHGIPSDWIECRILSVVTRTNMSGMHVQFVVGKGQSRLLAYVQPFQDSFWHEIEKFEPRAREWLFSLAWQFDGPGPGPRLSMPGPGQWNEEKAQSDGDTPPGAAGADELASDLKALYAIRDAALSHPGEAAAHAQPPSSRDAKGRAGS